MQKQQSSIKAEQNRLYKHVEFLTTLRPYRNYQNLESLEKVVQHLKNEFSSYGLQVTEQPFHASGNIYKNVVGVYNPQGSKVMVVGGHYDVCGDQPGADDNASAVAGLLESARMVAEAKPPVDYRIEFVAYCLEEPPFYQTNDMGSYHHAKSLNDRNADVIGLINYEMIGYFTEEAQPYPHPALKQMYPEKGNFILVVGNHEYHDFNLQVFELMKKDAEIDVQFIDDPRVEDLAGMSDQLSYWKFDYPALMINDTSFIRNKNYHQMTDDIDTLNFEKMTQVVSATYNAITGF